MTVAVAAPLRLPSWLETIISLLPRAKPAVRVSEPPDELRPLIEIARNVLGARDLADLHARLDTSIMRLRDLSALTPSEPQSTADAPVDDLPEDPPENSITNALGVNVARKLLQGMREFSQVHRAFEQVQKEPGSARSLLVQRALSVQPWSLHEGNVVPHALIESALAQNRGIVALGAIVAACVDSRSPERWLTNALADAFLAGMREMARLAASAGYEVALVKPEELWDLEALFREAEEADASFRATFEENVRAGRIGVPEDE